MRLVLEKRDVISFIGKAIGRTLTEEQVEVKTEPFEVIIYDAEEVLGEEAAPPPPSPARPAVPPQVKEKPVVIDDDGSLDELHAHSAALAARPPTVGGKGKRGKAVQRQLLPGESVDPRNPLDGGDVDG